MGGERIEPGGKLPVRPPEPVEAAKFKKKKGSEKGTTRLVGPKKKHTHSTLIYGCGSGGTKERCKI